MFGESQRPESQRPSSSLPGIRAGRPRPESADMKSFQDGAYAMAALSATVVAFRLLMKKGLLTREEAVRNLLDEAVQRAIFAESHEASSGRSTAELNRQSAEILKFIAESL
jgi:hypothetical protein